MKWAVYKLACAGIAYVHNPVSLTPPIHAFERSNPHLAKDYRHKTINRADESLARITKTVRQDSNRNQQIAALLDTGMGVLDVAERMNITRSQVDHVRRTKRLQASKLPEITSS